MKILFSILVGLSVVSAIWCYMAIENGDKLLASLRPYPDLEEMTGPLVFSFVMEKADSLENWLLSAVWPALLCLSASLLLNALLLFSKRHRKELRV